MVLLGLARRVDGVFDVVVFMSDRIRNLQMWISGHGYPVSIDGAWGPQTRKGVIEVFRNRSAPAATAQKINLIAAQNGFDGRAMRAVAEVESAGGGWDDKGLLKCVWERHWLWRRVKLAVPLLSDPKPGGYTIDANRDGVCDSWEKLADATGRFGFNTAAECASFGKFQIMGGHWKALGYSSVADFVWQLSRDEAAHYEAFARFIKVNGLTKALNAVDGNPDNCRALAKGYNGGGYEKGRYHEKIAAAWRRLA